MSKKLVKSRENKLLLGVCAGIADYLDLDPVIVRVVWGILTVLSFGVGLLSYVIAAILIPYEDKNENDEFEVVETINTDKERDGKSSRRNRIFIGTAFIIFGIAMFFKRYFIWMDTKIFLAILLILIGTFKIP